jgi:tetratricopeptide (TPR) repeat protein
VENVQVLYQEALARFRIKQLAQTEDVLDEVVQKSPDHRPALVLLGSTHQQMRRHVSALSYFERAAEFEAPNESLKELISLSRKKFE